MNTPSNENKDRNDYIYFQVLSGRTYQNIGDQFGMTRQRIEQIYKQVKERLRKEIKKDLERV